MSDYNHDFKKISFKNYFLKDAKSFSGQKYTRCKICSKCNLFVGMYDDGMFPGMLPNKEYHYFHLNKIEIFSDILNMTKLNMTCEEFIIKNILE